MFQEFLDNGSVTSIILMSYAAIVMTAALRVERFQPSNCPMILKHPVSAWFMFFSIPCICWPGIYIGLYSGWIAGITSFLLLPFVGTIIFVVARLDIGIQFIIACLAFPIGYYLSIISLVT